MSPSDEGLTRVQPERNPCIGAASRPKLQALGDRKEASTYVRALIGGEATGDLKPAWVPFVAGSSSWTSAICSASTISHDRCRPA